MIGILAILVAFGNSGKPQDAEGAIAHIGSQPFGHILLAVVTAGLFGYALWCFMQAIFDTDHDGKDVKGLGLRIGELCSGIAYLSLGMLAFHRIRGDAGPHHNSTVHWTAKLLAHPWGAALVALLGVILAIVGIGQVVYGIREKFRKYLRLSEASASDGEWIVQFGKWGYSAQGIVFLIVGGFLVSAAIYSDPRRARGLDGALQWVAQQAYGPWLLGLVAAGLGAYGLFMLVEARYRRLT